MAVNPVPDGYSTVTPYLSVKDAAQAIDFYKDVFGATDRVRMDGPDGRVMHAELDFGTSVIMLADESPDTGSRSPQTVGGTPVALMMYVPDVDAVFAKAIANGATEESPVTDQFYGDRSGNLIDPFGHRWNISTHIEDVTEEEMGKRMAAMGGPQT